MELRPVHAGVYHLWMTVLESKDGLYLGFYYNREVLEGQPLATIRDSFNELLSQVAAAPEARIADLGIVSQAEREKVLTRLAGTAPSPAGEQHSIVARIEDHARKRPEAVAASCGDAVLTYAELNKRANRMAHWLRAQGIGRESRLGIFGSRSLDMLITLLAVLKSGAAFVPLDPDHPDPRLKSIVEKASIGALVTSAELVERSSELAAGVSRPVQVICWHELPGGSGVPNPALWAGQSAANLELFSRLDDLAYVCYTSGSTGMPKGAMVEHRGMLNHLLAKISFLGLDQESVVGQNASHCFDISIWQFLAALLAGGRIVVYPPESLFRAGSLLELVEHDEVTVLETVPSLLEMMLNELPPEKKLTRLRHVISNAELLPIPLTRRWRERFPHIALVNTYGATECSDDTTHQLVGAADENTVRIPVGRSIPGAQHYVLDQELSPVPAGCTGQIAIAGDVVGRGYLANPSGTACAFVPDPFRDDGRRLYLTGDLGRWNSAGELEFLGRTDHQIKIHGHRVELGEIESALGSLAGVRQAAVVFLEENQSPRLLAYWVGEPGLDAGKLRDHARRELPPYMVPNAFIQVRALPLTPNGKVDRSALPKPPDSQGDSFVPPRDEIEFKLAKLWRAELGVSAVGVFDNFFERGGHSLKAVSLVNRMQTEFKISLPLRTLFDHQTIDSLSRVIRDRQDSSQFGQAAGALVCLQPARPDSAVPPLFLVHPHGGTVFCYQALAAALGERIPVFGIQCRGLDEDEKPVTSIPEMAAAYIKDILEAQPQGPYHVAGWSLGGPIAFEIARQLEAAGLQVAFLGVFDSAIPSSTGKNLAHLLPGFPDTDDLGSETSMARFARWFFRADERQFENLSDSQIVDALREMAQRAGMLPPDVSPAMLKRFVAVAITSAMALLNYQPAGPVQTDVVLFRAAQSLVDDPQWWAPWTRGDVQTVTVEGSHYDMVFPPAVQALAVALRKHLLPLASAVPTVEAVSQ
jgi:amino acid adenylation domain-containing protein